MLVDRALAASIANMVNSKAYNTGCIISEYICVFNVKVIHPRLISYLVRYKCFEYAKWVLKNSQVFPVHEKIPKEMRAAGVFILGVFNMMEVCAFFLFVSCNIELY